MFPGPTDIPKGRADGGSVVVGRPLDIRHSLLAQELPDGTGSLDGKVFAFRVEPSLIKAFNQQGSRSHACQEHVLVEREGVGVVGVFVIGPAEPVPERDNLGRDRLSEITFGERYSPTSGLDRHAIEGYYFDARFAKNLSNLMHSVLSGEEIDFQKAADFINLQLVTVSKCWRSVCAKLERLA